MVRRVGLVFSALFMLAIISGCASFNSTKNNLLMPRGTEYAKTPWENYNDMKEMFDFINISSTTVKDLEQRFSFSIVKTPNIRQLNSLSVRDLFLKNPSIKLEDLPSGVQYCLKIENFDNCRGYEFRLKNTKTKGEGSLFLRMFNFYKKDRTVGPDMGGFYIFCVGDVIVYKLEPEGVSIFDTTKTVTKPLGPFQDLGDLFQKGAGAAIPIK